MSKISATVVLSGRIKHTKMSSLILFSFSRSRSTNYPLVPVSITFRGKIHRMEVAVNSHLKHPLILGTDWPAFTQLLGKVCADASWPIGRGREEAAALTG